MIEDDPAADLMRSQYRPLSREEEGMMKELKEIGNDFAQSLARVASIQPTEEKERCTRISREKIEEAVMWGVKAITSRV